MKKAILIRTEVDSHWVGDGFPVRNFFSYSDVANQISPFLLMDYAGPKVFPPTSQRLGVGEHPHRGFETVTIVYSGEVEHRDSTGAGGTIGPGDVQWMTAASGIVHEEFHGRDFAKRGGDFEMIQLWVNLPKANKMNPPGYQEIKNHSIPLIELPENAGTLRIIAGSFCGKKGPARTFSPVNLWDLRLNSNTRTLLAVPATETAVVFLRKGSISVPGTAELKGPALCVLDPEESDLLIEAHDDSELVFLGGKPLKEPIVGYGPFVMNTENEIREAFRDYQSGTFGKKK
ncbi:MAG: pirin family protein [Bdellovibrionales bacterium]|nr:pirin family protein [Bdellovibrionales bacterium]